MKPLDLLVRIGLLLAGLGLWLGPTPVAGRTTPASAQAEAAHQEAGAALVPVGGSQATAPAPAEGSAPPPWVRGALPAVRHLRSPGLAARDRQPDPTTRARSQGPLYHVLRSGQAHRSAP